MQNEHMPDAPAELVIARVYDAPRELVFKAWTDAERLARWWGPKGYTMGAIQLDLRPGGAFRYSMRSPAGLEMWGKFVYREIAAPGRLVFTTSFCDADGTVLPNPMAPTWPLEVMNVLTLTETGGKTTLALRGTPHDATETERKIFFGALENIHRGFKGTLDQLAEELASEMAKR